jgi:hypothetical protein
MASSRKHRLISGSGMVSALLLMLALFAPVPKASAASEPMAPGAVALSNTPIPADNTWHGYVESNGAPTVAPVAVASTAGTVTNAQGLVNGSGTTTLTNVPGQVGGPRFACAPGFV